MGKCNITASIYEEKNIKDLYVPLNNKQLNNIIDLVKSGSTDHITLRNYLCNFALTFPQIKRILKNCCSADNDSYSNNNNNIEMLKASVIRKKVDLLSRFRLTDIEYYPTDFILKLFKSGIIYKKGFSQANLSFAVYFLEKVLAITGLKETGDKNYISVPSFFELYMEVYKILEDLDKKYPDEGYLNLFNNDIRATLYWSAYRLDLYTESKFILDHLYLFNADFVFDFASKSNIGNIIDQPEIFNIIQDNLKNKIAHTIRLSLPPILRNSINSINVDFDLAGAILLDKLGDDEDEVRSC